MQSSSYKDWLQAWMLIRDKVKEDIKSFDEFYLTFNIDQYGCYINDMLYELEMELHNEGLADLHFMAQRAELCRWVYTQFPDETELNLANFHASEAESLWILGKRDLAESLIEELIRLYPKSSIGYVTLARFYWTSDRSYQFGPDYEKAESIYRHALSIQGLDDCVTLVDNLENMLQEKEHPEDRERIKQSRLKHIQRRKNLS